MHKPIFLACFLNIVVKIAENMLCIKLHGRVVIIGMGALIYKNMMYSGSDIYAWALMVFPCL